MARRHPNRSRIEVGTMSDAGFWVAATTTMPAALPRATMSRSTSTNSSRALALALGVEGELVDDHDDEAESDLPVDLPEAPIEQQRVAGLHLVPQFTQRLGGLLDVRPDEPLGAVPPGSQFDQLAVEAPELGRRVEGSCGHDQRQGVRLAGPRLAAEEQVVTGELEHHQAVVLVVAEGKSAPEVGPLDADPRPGDGRTGQRIAGGHDELGPTGCRPVLLDADGGRTEGDGQRLGARRQVGGRAAGRQLEVEDGARGVGYWPRTVGAAVPSMPTAANTLP